MHENCAFLNKDFALLPVLLYFCYRESRTSFTPSKTKLSYKSSAHLKDGIYKVSEFSLNDVGESNFQLVNVGLKLLILPVYDEWNFFGEILDVYELYFDGTVVKQNMMPPSIIKQRFQC